MPEKRLKKCRDAYICEYCKGDGLYHGSQSLTIDSVYNFCRWCNGRGYELSLGLWGYQNNDPGLWKNITRSNEVMFKSSR